MEGRRIWPWNLHFQEAQCFGCKGPRDHTLRNTAQKRLGAQGKDRKWELPGNARPPGQVPLRGRGAVGQMRDPLEESGRTAPEGDVNVGLEALPGGGAGWRAGSKQGPRAPSWPTAGPAPTGELSPTTSTSLLPHPGSAHRSEIAGGARGPPQGLGRAARTAAQAGFPARSVLHSPRRGVCPSGLSRAPGPAGRAVSCPVDASV